MVARILTLRPRGSIRVWSRLAINAHIPFCGLAYGTGVLQLKGKPKETDDE
jgi:hypothetical protein